MSFSPQVKPTKKRRTIEHSWLHPAKKNGWPRRQDQAPTKSWPSRVITLSCDALGTFSHKLTLCKTRL